MNFNPNEEIPETAGPSGDFLPLPSGWYHGTILKAVDHTNDNPDTGLMLMVGVEIDADEHPEHRGRQIYKHLCYNHIKETPRNIARRHLQTICFAGDIEHLTHADQCVGARVMIKLKPKPARTDKNGTTHPPSNEIDDWRVQGTAAPKPRVTRQAINDDPDANLKEEHQEQTERRPKPSWRR